MPTYKYHCKNCDHEFEKFQSMTDSKLRKCPECGRLKLNRLIGAGGGFIFKKGVGGFYCKDYADSPKKETVKEAPKNENWKKGPAKKETNSQ
jgi:putative FmdB family regulatory protein